MFFSLILACSTPTTTELAPAQPPIESPQRSKDARKGEFEIAHKTLQYPGGVYNITMGGKAIGLMSISPPPPKLAGAPPRGGLELYCFADGTGFPYLLKKSDDTDESHPWSVAKLDGGDPCADVATEMFAVVPCKNGCPAADYEPYAKDEARQDGLQPGLYTVKDAGGKVARVAVYMIKGEPGQRLETWCLSDGFRWPEKDRPWSEFAMTARQADPAKPFTCDTGENEAKYASTHLGTLPKP